MFRPKRQNMSRKPKRGEYGEEEDPQMSQKDTDMVCRKYSDFSFLCFRCSLWIDFSSLRPPVRQQAWPTH